LGIDLACRAAHVASLAGPDGTLVWRGRSFYTRPADLEKLWRDLACDDPAELTVVMEPTRNAWIPVAAWFRRRGARVVLVPTTQSASLSRFLCKGSSCCCSNLEVAVDAFGVDEGELGQSLFPVRHDLSLDEPAGGLAFAGGLAGFLGAVTSAFVLDGADR
jgi:hypothetical protein